MSFSKAISDAIRGTIGSQWLQVVKPEEFDEGDIVVPGTLGKTVGRDSTGTSGPRGTITNGSVFYVPEGTAACILSGNCIESVAVDPGTYEYRNGQPSLLAGDGIGSILEEVATRFSFGGSIPEDKAIAFVNLREIRDVKFGTTGPQPYHDLFYGVDLEVIAHGSFSLRVLDPEIVLREFVPAGILRYSIKEERAKAQLVSEVTQSLIASIGGMSGKYRVSELPSHLEEVTEAMAQDSRGVGSWPERFGLGLVSVSLHGVGLSDDSRNLIREYSSNRMSVHAYEGISTRAADIAAKQQIASGIREHGMGDAAGTLLGINLSQSVSLEPNTDSFDRQAEMLKKLKELLDSGVLTQEEFDIKKREILGLQSPNC